ncbi:unnamed protein product, partial [marine sediment metagenome]
YEAAKLSRDASLEAVGDELLSLTEADHLVITRSQDGMTLFTKTRDRFDFPVKFHEVMDVTGAGDTVLAMIAVAYASNLSMHETLSLSNVAASIAIERLGCARVSLSDIASRLLETDAQNKIFDEEHLFVLEQALTDKKLTILGLSTNEGISSDLFHQIQTLAKGNDDERFMVYLTNATPDESFVSLLASLHEIDYIVLQSQSLHHLCESIHPAKVFALENKELIELDHHSTLLNLV